MNTTIFFSKLLLDAFRDTHKVCKYFKLIKLNNYLVIVKIFVIKFFYSFENIRNRIKNKKINNNMRNNSVFIKDINFNINKIINDLDNLGHSKIFELNNKVRDDLLNLSLEAENFDLNKIKIDKDTKALKKQKDEDIQSYIARLKNIGISRLTSTINLNQQSKLTEFITSPEVLNLARGYLNSDKISINATFFISNPLKITEEEKYKNAQYFHWDNDFTKFFKMYIYLNDVDENTGPHIFVPGTHKNKSISNKLCRLYSDENIKNNYDSFKKFLGKAGSIFFVDGYGIHKGELPNKNFRLMMNIHFGRGKILYSKNDKYIELK